MKMQIKQLLAIGTSAFVLAGCCTTGHATHWEYKVVAGGKFSANQEAPADWPMKQEALMDNLGKDGWIFITESNGYLYFKRLQK